MAHENTKQLRDRYHGALLGLAVDPRSLTFLPQELVHCLDVLRRFEL
jgi:hypothetical protein